MDANLEQPEEAPARIHEVRATDKFRMLEELEIVQRDLQGEAVREMSMRTDGRKEGTIDIDRMGQKERVRIGATRLESPDNLKDENEYLVRFAQALTKEKGQDFMAVTKEKEDCDFPDVWLRTGTELIGVQITHFARRAVGRLNSEGSYSAEVRPEGIAEEAIAAIFAKRLVDPATAAKTYLLLICPYPIRPVLQESIRRCIDSSGTAKTYLETWISSLSEPAFRIQ